jgi:MOSC domain-containing protein YiiM
MSEMNELLAKLPPTGELTWIGLRPARRAPPEVVEQTRAVEEQGLEGDHAAAGKREVTLIQAEHLDVVAALCGRESIDPGLLRRNLVVRGINLLALKGRRFRIGDAVFEGTGPCPPCSRMEENLGEFGYQAMRGHGGICARVVTAGALRIGDALVPLTASSD